MHVKIRVLKNPRILKIWENKSRILGISTGTNIFIYFYIYANALKLGIFENHKNSTQKREFLIEYNYTSLLQ